LSRKKPIKLKSLVKQRTNIAGNVEEVERFTTWWNNNLATVVAYYNGYYRAFLLVYVKEDNSVKVFPHDSSSNYWGEHSRKQHNYLSDAKSETSWLRNELSKGYGKYYDNPILLINPYSDCSRSFDSFVCEPYVVKNYNLSKAKVGDILWVEKVIFGKSVLGWKNYSHEELTNRIIDIYEEIQHLNSNSAGDSEFIEEERTQFSINNSQKIHKLQRSLWEKVRKKLIEKEKTKLNNENINIKQQIEILPKQNCIVM